MSRNIINFPVNGATNQYNTNKLGFSTIEERYSDVEFIDNKEQENFIESMNVFIEALKMKNYKKRKKLLKKAIEISKYNIDALAVNIITDETVPLEQRRIALESLEKEVLEYPIKNSGLKKLEKNSFYMTLKEYEATFYIDHNLIGYKNPYADILDKINHIEELNMMVLDSMKIYLKLDEKEKFDELYNKLVDDIKTIALVLLYKLLFEIRKNDGEAVKTMMLLKYHNPMIEVALDAVKKEELFYINRHSAELAEIMLTFEELEEWLELPYYFDYILLLNEEIRTSDDLEYEVGKQTMLPIDLEGNPIFENIAIRELGALCGAGLVDEKSFLDYTKKEVLALDGIGKKTIERLTSNGVKFKGDI